jgi:hypothetical protein
MEAPTPNKRKKKRARPETEAPSPPPSAAPASASVEGRKPAPVLTWVLFAASLLGLTIKLIRCSTRDSASKGFTLQAPPRPTDEAASFQCGVDCKKDCYAMSDPLMQSSCMRLCDERCALADEQDPSACHAKCDSACSSADSMNARSACAAQCNANCDAHEAKQSAPDTAGSDDGAMKIGIVECDNYLTEWRKCRPGDKKDIKDMAERIGAAAQSADHTGVIELCTRMSRDMKKLCGVPDSSSSAAASASTAPSDKGAVSASSSASAARPR